MPLDLPELARSREIASNRARAEVLQRGRRVAIEIKPDGSPVTEADRAAEHVLRQVLREALPEATVLGEELGREGAEGAPLQWVIDPIDGTIAFSRGIPLFATLVALLEQGEPVLGMIDLPALGERYTGWRGGGCWRNRERVSVSRETQLERALVSHGDPYCFERAGETAAFQRMAQRLPMLRGYTDGFGHALVLAGGVDAMVDLDLSPWDTAATRILVPEAGGRCITLRYPERSGVSKSGLVLGAPALVEALAGWLERGVPTG